MSSRGHETIDHTADMGIRGWGDTPAEAFEEAAAALLELMVEPEGLAPGVALSIRRSGRDLTELLLEFLNGLIGEADRAGIVLGEVTIDRFVEENGNWRLEATAKGVPYEAARERLLVEVKAATYYGAAVSREDSGRWVARCVVDL